MSEYQFYEFEPSLLPAVTPTTAVFRKAELDLFARSPALSIESSDQHRIFG
ncbi:hypothetical protein I6I07_07410 [Achromobacter deleyi]|uniref:Uncharacterized protein n=1 Tax=Achromobacter deleyi TaxID=1353891 RepID=A0A7T4E4B6_9BURK|nr:hypothetical protein [Achromobacter deleyi]QQB36428.1 hypothetical protein I6I07_07410 [Achromobacter deleyi]